MGAGAAAAVGVGFVLGLLIVQPMLASTNGQIAGRVSPGLSLLLLPYPGRDGPRDPGGHLLVRGAGGAVRAGSRPPAPPSLQRPRGGCRPASLLPAPSGRRAFPHSRPLRWERAAVALCEAPVRSSGGLPSGIINLSTK